ncbi:hypothetical protein [Nonomuraea sp. B19D2]
MIIRALPLGEEASCSHVRVLRRFVPAAAFDKQIRELNRMPG